MSVEAIGPPQRGAEDATGENGPPDREALLDELARCFVQAAVTRLLRERLEPAEKTDPCPPLQERKARTRSATRSPSSVPRRPRRGRRKSYVKRVEQSR